MILSYHCRIDSMKQYYNVIHVSDLSTLLSRVMKYGQIVLEV